MRGVVVHCGVLISRHADELVWIVEIAMDYISASIKYIWRKSKVIILDRVAGPNHHESSSSILAPWIASTTIKKLKQSVDTYA